MLQGERSLPSKRYYSKDLAKLHEKLDGPTRDFSEFSIADGRNKLSEMQPAARFMAIKRAIDHGDDLIVAVLTKSDAFLVDGLLSDAERDVLLNHWRRARFPAEFERLQRLECESAPNFGGIIYLTPSNFCARF